MSIKKVFLYVLICLFCNLHSFCQIQSGSVIYAIKKKTTSLFNQNRNTLKFKKFQKEVDNIIQSFQFVLTFNKNNSLFYLEKNLSFDSLEFHTKIAILSIRGKSTFFTNNNKKLILEQTDFLDKYFLIDTPYLEWKFTNEKKYINNYSCYKVIAKKKLLGPNSKDKFMTFNAWYCPELSFNFGPFEFSGLPGLVLEISNDKLIYFAKEIKFTDKEIEIKEPTKGKKVTQEEFDAFAKKMSLSREQN